jgi:curved DNA-binding protein CbpA
MATPNTGNRPNKRRSTRVKTGVFLDIRGTDGDGKSFMERRVTLEVSFHGCRYYSRYSLPANSYVTMEISNKKEKSGSADVRARVAWCRRSSHLGGLFLVGVEFETPGNIWDIADPPVDWRKPEPPRPAKLVSFERELKDALAIVENGNYYQLLKMTAESPRTQIRQNYYDLVRNFHPDRHMDHPEWMEQLHKIMEGITAAYSTLTNEEERQKYDERLASPSTYGMGRKQGEVQLTAELCVGRARECLKGANPGGAIVWLRRALVLEPTSAKHHALLARTIATLASSRQEAAELFEKSLELDPENINVRLHLANLYEEMKLPWRAHSHYEKVLEIDPENARALGRLRKLDGASGTNGLGKQSLIDRILHPSAKKIKNC